MKVFKNQFIFQFLVFALLFNAAGTLFAASSLVGQAQNYQNEEVALICTGSTFKWISVAVYQKTGKFEFVEKPADAPQYSKNIKCAQAYLHDSHGDKAIFTHYLNLTAIKIHFNSLPTINAEYLVKKHQLATSRAPPKHV